MGPDRRLTRVYVPGTFDCLHIGHLNLLDFAASLGDEVWVGLNTDEFAERYKRRPVYSLEDRFRIMQSLRQVDEVIVNSGDEDSRVALMESAADIIVHGDDWTGEAYLHQLGVTHEWLVGHGIQIVYAPYTQGISTTEIIGDLHCRCDCACAGPEQDPREPAVPDAQA